MNKVVHVINGEYYAGAERVQEHLLRGTSAKADFDCRVVLYKDGVFPQKSGLADTLSFFELFGFRPFKLAGYLRDQSPDVVHCHSPITLLLTVLALILSRTQPVLVFHVHSPTIEDTESRIKNLIKYVLERFAVLVGKPKVIGVSESVIERSRYLSGRAGVYVVDNGVPVAEARARVATAEPPVVVTFAGLIRPRKGFDVVLKALAALSAEELSQIRLAVYGEFDNPNYQDEIHALVTSSGLADTVVFHGFDKNIPERIAEGSVFVMPSLYGEGLPMVLLEAMSVGAAIVASRVGGIDGVIRDGIDGLLVPAADPGALKGALVRLINDEPLRYALSQSALERQQKHYSTEAMVRSVLEIYGCKDTDG